MPLLTIPAAEAIATRKANPVSEWPERGDGNRVEPFCAPTFDAPFRIRPGDSVFTIGSCFARNVEQEMARANIRLPTREVMARPEFVNLEAASLNNYGTPSIWNELAWSFGEEAFDPDAHLVEVMPNRWVDLHLNPAIRPETREVVLRRREAIFETYRASATCKMIVLTLGYVEVWKDTWTGSYLNAVPRPSLIRRDPKRYELAVLDAAEATDYLMRALDILRRHGRPDMRVVLTVSPVPLSQTHRDEDVITANAYSKSVLRVAAETAVVRHDFVTYFPSYESVTHSDRQLAWQDDLHHVNQGIVRFNVQRMMDAFLDGPEGDGDGNDAQAPDETEALGRVRELEAHDHPRSGEMLAELAARFAHAPEIVAAHARWLCGRGRYEEALRVASVPSDGQANASLTRARSMALVNLARPAEAAELLGALVQTLDLPTRPLLEQWISAALASDEEKAITTALHHFITRFPVYSARARMKVGLWYLGQGKIHRARTLLKDAVNANPDFAGAHLALGELELSRGYDAAARRALTVATPGTPSEIRRAEALRARLRDPYEIT
ncbi:GSCFA domain-containing protein [Jannaschia sp. W003]|uniref:GSCFA domain-containing protein n=1 Tax=Jannaschia sp. W003 TaxID=2867012 RepID=UPI0021A3EF98|nr:GSCFA domain-containing protein [Jannaschia sp. W003]UWQ19985.1 GSCFA domain-containing protein [Jannaschia sp. W003]